MAVDIQKIVDALGFAARDTRSNYHLTLGGLIAILSEQDPGRQVEYVDGGAPGEEMSYRCYYSDLAFEDQRSPKSCGELLAQCQKALNAHYEGYKGGDYVMDATTPLWRSGYSACSDLAIIAAELRGDALVLITKELA